MLDIAYECKFVFLDYNSVGSGVSEDMHWFWHNFMDSEEE